jgi:hypothetical protein
MWKFDDEVVKKENPGKNGANPVSKNAYMLIYAKQGRHVPKTQIPESCCEQVETANDTVAVELAKNRHLIENATDEWRTDFELYDKFLLNNKSKKTHWISKTWLSDWISVIRLFMRWFVGWLVGWLVGSFIRPFVRSLTVGKGTIESSFS